MKMKAWIGIAAAVFPLYLTGSIIAADFDGDGVADEFTFNREVGKVTSKSDVRRVNPWKIDKAKKTAKGVGFLVRLSRTPQTYLLHDSDFFDTPMWKEGKPPVEVITRQDRRYREWKKQVPALQADALQVGTEAGIDILLYWNGKRWELFWPDEDP